MNFRNFYASMFQIILDFSYLALKSCSKELMDSLVGRYSVLAPLPRVGRLTSLCVQAVLCSSFSLAGHPIEGYGRINSTMSDSKTHASQRIGPKNFHFRRQQCQPIKLGRNLNPGLDRIFTWASTPF